jgi:hypothetical protein
MVNRKLQFAIRSSVLALFVVGAVSYRSLVESTENDLWVRHTDQALEKLQDLLAAIQTVESNTRGYLLTSDDSFLSLYRAGKAPIKDPGANEMTLLTEELAMTSARIAEPDCWQFLRKHYFHPASPIGRVRPGMSGQIVNVYNSEQTSSPGTHRISEQAA